MTGIALAAEGCAESGIGPAQPRAIPPAAALALACAATIPAATAQVLQSVLDTRITPELVPTGEDGDVQSTEDTIGPYALHDFSLYYVLRHGFGPRKIAFLAHHAWSDPSTGSWPPGFPAEERYGYGLTEIRRWLAVFVRRFFGFSQFKRSAVPNGPKVMAGGALSPRGEWRAPSDGNAVAWLAELEHVPQTEDGREP